MASLEEKIQQLIDMVSVWDVKRMAIQLLNCANPRPQGASRAQARRAFQRNTDVMEAAQEFFDGKYDDVKDSDDAMEDPQASSSTKRPSRLEVCRVNYKTDHFDLSDIA